MLASIVPPIRAIRSAGGPSQLSPATRVILPVKASNPRPQPTLATAMRSGLSRQAFSMIVMRS